MVILLKIFGSLVCGCLVIIYVLIVETGTHHANNRYERVESLGAIVPMLGALLGILGFWLPWRGVSIGSFVLAFLLIVMGRMLFESFCLPRDRL